MFRRTQLQITLWAAAVLFGAIVTLEIVTYFSIVTTLDDQIDRDIEDTVDEVLSDLGPVRAAPPAGAGSEAPAEEGGVFVLVYDATRELVANPSDVRLPGAPFPDYVTDALRGRREWHTVSVGGERIRILVTPAVEDGTLSGAVIGGRSLERRDERVRLVAASLLGGGALGAVLALGIGYLVGRRALRPLQLAYERQDSFVGDASHELRSPIAVIRTSADLLLRSDLTAEQRELAAEIEDVASEAGLVLDDLLEMARLSAPENEPAPFADLAEAAADAISRLEPVIEETGVICTATLAPAPATVKPAEARRIAHALLENVVRHTPSGTNVTIVTETEGHRAVLRVEDNGPGVPESERARIFERFVQLDAARTPGAGRGAGLGLALVHAIVERRGGSAEAQAGARGGLRVEVSLPIAR